MPTFEKVHNMKFVTITYLTELAFKNYTNLFHGVFTSQPNNFLNNILQQVLVRDYEDL